jgi:hypothetical protein
VHCFYSQHKITSWLHRVESSSQGCWSPTAERRGYLAILSLTTTLTRRDCYSASQGETQPRDGEQFANGHRAGDGRDKVGTWIGSNSKICAERASDDLTLSTGAHGLLVQVDMSTHPRGRMGKSKGQERCPRGGGIWSWREGKPRSVALRRSAGRPLGPQPGPSPELPNLPLTEQDTSLRLLQTYF